MNGDLTTGTPLKRILRFCVPLLLGTLSQQVYNITDSIIVGKHLGVEAFAAIGSTGSLNVLIIGFAVALCTGLCVPIAQNYGAGDVKALRKAEANGLYIAAAFSVLITVAMLLFTRSILIALQTPENLLDDACAYIRTLCAGSSALILYNMVIGFMRALGDSKTPLFYLILAALFNILLDLLFVIVFPMGATGVALATVLAQFLSALLAIRSIRKNFPILHLTRESLRPCGVTLGKLTATALPIGLQSSITAVGSIMLQRVINGLGASAVAAMVVGGKIHTLIFAPIEAVGIGVMIFACQNYGARQIGRVRGGIMQLMLATSGYALLGTALAWFAGTGLMQIFLRGGDAEVYQLTEYYLRVSSSFFIPLNIIYIYRNALQGLGYPKLAMCSGVNEMVARIVVATVMVPALGFTGACLGAPTAWTMAALFVAIAYAYAVRRRTKECAAPQVDIDF